VKQFAVFICGLIILIQLGLLGLGYVRADEPDHLPTPIHPPVEPKIPLDLEGIWTFANGVATNWRADAQLVAASMQIDWPHAADDLPLTELARGGWIFMAYLSQDDLLTMRIDRGSGTIVETRLTNLDDKARDAYAAHPIDLNAATTRSGTAAQAAEAAYGLEFRNACRDQRFMSWLNVEHDLNTGTPHWHIEYEARADEPQPSMKLDIDWQTGDIRNVENATAPCA
jgi:hypothetical protein